MTNEALERCGGMEGIVTTYLLRERLASNRGEIVLRIIDSGREFGFWLTPFSADELERWWRAQSSFDGSPISAARLDFGGGTILPPTLKLPGEFFDAPHPDGTDLWDELRRSGQHYVCELCCDDDSYLKRHDDLLLSRRIPWPKTRLA